MIIIWLGIVDDSRLESRNWIRLDNSWLDNPRLNDARFNNLRLNDARLNNARLNNPRIKDAGLNSWLENSGLDDSRFSNSRHDQPRFNDSRLCESRLDQSWFYDAWLEFRKSVCDGWFVRLKLPGHLTGLEVWNPVGDSLVGFWLEVCASSRRKGRLHVGTSHLRLRNRSAAHAFCRRLKAAAIHGASFRKRAFGRTALGEAWAFANRRRAEREDKNGGQELGGTVHDLARFRVGGGWCLL